MTTVPQSDGLCVTPPSILVVDAKEDNFKRVEEILYGMDVNFVFASSASQALDLFEKHEFAVALLDICMPHMNGLDVALQMRSRGSNLPIIFVTAKNYDEQFAMRAYALGSADFLYRPLEPAALRSKVKLLLDLFCLRQAEGLKVRELEALHESLVQQWIEADNMTAELALQKVELEHRNGELTLRNSQLDSFTQVVSHDLRQPLGSILDYLELIQDSSGDQLDADTLAWVKTCRRIGQNMQALIDDVLDYSRLGAKPLAMSSVDANTVLNNALESLHAAVKESGAQISYGGLATVLGSERLLTCLLQNLIGNAIKYRGTVPPEVHVSSAWLDDEHKWRFRIADNGRGFKDVDRDRIFEMFGRGGNVGGTPGTGVGLATCKKIVEAHGGRIWAESKPGKGSEFFFVLQDGGLSGKSPVDQGK